MRRLSRVWDGGVRRTNGLDGGRERLGPAYGAKQCRRLLGSRPHAFTSAYNRIRFNAERRKGDAGPPLDVYDKELSTLEGLRLAVDDIVAAPAGGRLSWRAVCTRLRSVNGFGGSGFMAKEVLHDAMGWPSMRRLVRDEGDWTPPGPGARRGLNRLYGRPRDMGASATGDSAGEARFITEMRLLLRTLRSLDPAFCKSVDLNIHDVQFQLCEYDKYRRVGDGGHVHPYRPHVSMNIPDLPARPHPLSPRAVFWPRSERRTI